MARFWESDPVVSPQVPGGPQPVFTVPDPAGDAERERKEAAAAREAESLRLRQEAAARSAEQFEFERSDREQRGGANTTESEKTAAFLATRVADEIDLLGEIVGGKTPQVGPEAARWVLGDLAANVLNEEDRQRVEAAQLNILDAALTLGTGAAYTREQLVNYQRAYFPQLGDKPGTVRDKQRRLESLLAAARVKAGAAAPAIDKALAAVRGDTTKSPEMRGALPVGTEVELNMDRWGRDGFDRDAALMDLYGVTPNQEATVTAFWNENRGNPGLTPDGVRQFYARIGIPAPSEEAILQGIAAAKEGKAFGGLDTTAAEKAWQAAVDERVAQYTAQQGEAGSIDLAGQGLMAGLGDEAAGIGGGIANVLTGEGSFGEGYRLENEVRDQYLQQGRERSGGIGTAAELIGNAGSGGFLARMPASAQAAIREAALAGAVPGFGYGEGVEESLAGAGMGAAAGAVVGKVLSGRGSAPTPPKPGAKVVQAADDLNADLGTNIVPLPADVGGSMVRRATGATAQMPLGAGPIITAGKAVTDESGKAVQAIAQKVGAPQELETAGATALAGAQKWMKTTSAKVNSLYTRARKLSEGVRVPLTNAQRVLDEHIAKLRETPGGAKGMADLEALRDEIGEEYTIDGIKAMRTEIRDRFVAEGIRKSSLERRMMQVVDAAEQDVADGLLAAGKAEAAQAWTAAAAEARKRLMVIDNVLAPIIGKRTDALKSGEQIMQAVSRMSKSDNAKLAQFIKALPDNEASSVRATVISRLGTKNADATDFSLGNFLGQWEKMTPGAKRTLFGGELTEALDKVATVAGGAKEAQRFANFSNTGSTIGMLATGGLGVSALSNPVLATAALASQYGLGRLLASPGFARWLARMPKNPAAAQKHVSGLSRIAAAETAIAQDALGLQRVLTEAFEQGRRPLAAQPVPVGDQSQTEDPTGNTGETQ